MKIPVLLALALTLFYWVWTAYPRSIQAGREQLLRAQGQASGAIFVPVDPPRSLGDWDKTCILFDPDARKACIVNRKERPRRSISKYLRTSQLKWTENSRKSGVSLSACCAFSLRPVTSTVRGSRRRALQVRRRGTERQALLSILMP